MNQSGDIELEQGRLESAKTISSGRSQPSEPPEIVGAVRGR